jgi:hypothetical protein
MSMNAIRSGATVVVVLLLAGSAGANAVTSRRQGRSIVYAAGYAGMQKLMDFLKENCCQGSGGAYAPEPVGPPREN